MSATRGNRLGQQAIGLLFGNLSRWVPPGGVLHRHVDYRLNPAIYRFG